MAWGILRPSLKCATVPLHCAAGDMLDMMLDPSALKCFTNLHILNITSSMYYRMNR